MRERLKQKEGTLTRSMSTIFNQSYSSGPKLMTRSMSPHCGLNNGQSREILVVRYEELLDQGRKEQEEAVQKRQDEIITLQQTVRIGIKK